MASIRLPSFIIRAPPQLRPLLFARYSSKSTASAITEHLPRIAQPSLWQTFIPRFMRRDRASPLPAPKKRGFWSRFLANPASGVIILAMLTGNASIHIIRAKRGMKLSSQKADEKIRLLREVIERVQKGEDVDVEKLLGTGDPKMEEEWFDVIRELEKEDQARSRNQRQRLRRQAQDAEVEEKSAGPTTKKDEAKESEERASSKRRPEFL